MGGISQIDPCASFFFFNPSDSFSGVVCGASAYEVVVPAHGKAIVKTDLAVATPLDCYARIGIDYSLLCVY